MNMNTYRTMELQNGQSVRLTLNLKRLLLLKSNHLDLYKEVSRIIIKGTEDIMEFIKIIYAGYLCALEKGSFEMPFDEFIEVIPQDFGELAEITGDLISPKKK